MTKLASFAMVMVWTLVGCSGKSSPTSPTAATQAGATSAPSPTPAPTPIPTAGANAFTAVPIDLNAVDAINPLGHMTTPFNALPQPRLYLVLRDRTQLNPIFAPAGGTVSSIWTPDASRVDYRIDIAVSSTVSYFLDHITLEDGIAVGGRIEAGQRIAHHGGHSCCLDFGLSNTAITNFFANPGRYSPANFNADSPLKYFVGPAQSQLYEKVNRVSDGKDGKANYDIASRLVGGWFHEDVPVAGSMLVDAWTKQLAFAYSNTHPSMILVTIPGTLPMVAVWAVQDGATDPASVSVASGKVSYRLFYKQPPVSEGGDKSSTQAGLLIVQMLDDARIRVEVFPGSSNATAEFTGQSRIYLR